MAFNKKCRSFARQSVKLRTSGFKKAGFRSKKAGEERERDLKESRCEALGKKRP